MSESAGPRHNLPLALSSFVGREEALAALGPQLRLARLLTLTGPGGCGKTRLALELARRAVPGFAGGVWLVELAPLADPAEVARAVAQALAIREQPGRAPLDTVAEALRDADLLLVLDNCEHLIDACASLAYALLRACPDLRILATSREALALPGEMVWLVAPLAVPDPAVPPEALRRAEAVRLFVARAAAVRPGFAPDDRMLASVAQICRRLDGIPLAIELAAARVAALTADEIAARLDGRFVLLTGGSRVAPARQRTLRAALDWSFALLPPGERVLLRRLAVFSGGWTLAAAESVCADASLPGGEVVAGLLRLVDQSLVVAEQRVGATRYHFLETIREYAREQLEAAGERDAVQARHALAYLHLAEDAATEWYGAGQAAWLGRLEADAPNLRAALAWSLDHDPPDLGLRLATALAHFWDVRGHLGEGCEWLARALAASGGATEAERAPALAELGRLERLRGNYPAARARLEEGIALGRAGGAQAHLTRSLQLLGEVAGDEGRYDEARALLEEGARLARSSGDRPGLAGSLLVLGELARAQGDDARAEALNTEALALARQLGDRWRTGVLLHNLGRVLARRGTLDGARRAFHASLRLAQGLGTPVSIAHCLAGVAGVLGAQGQLLAAARLIGATERALADAGAVIDFADRAEYERDVALVRARLGAEAFATAYEAGRALTRAEAVAEALTGVDPDTAAGDDRAGTGAPGDGAGLTAREREVLRLVAEGCSNKAIAAALSISERTVNSHLVHIFDKLDVNSRAAATAAALRLGLAE